MNLQPNWRRGATLTDLVVAIALAAILLAVGTTCMLQSARVQSPTTTCRNNLRQISLAMEHFEANRGYFPGILNPVQAHTNGGSLQTGGYLPTLLYYLERNDLMKEWVDGNRPTPYMSHLNCPANFPPNTTSDYLCYVVNAGMADITGVAEPEIQASGVCFDRTGSLYKPIQVDMAYLNQNDGASTTLLLTENLDADHWGLDGAANCKRWHSFVWHRDPVPSPAAFNFPATSTSRADASIALARPSSNHPGGVNVVFCDGHYEFIKDGIDYDAWRQMMTSDRALCP